MTPQQRIRHRVDLAKRMIDEEVDLVGNMVGRTVPERARELTMENIWFPRARGERDDR